MVRKQRLVLWVLILIAGLGLAWFLSPWCILLAFLAGFKVYDALSPPPGRQEIFIRKIKSGDWKLAETAIAELPGPLDIDQAIDLLIPFSIGEGYSDIDISGWDRKTEELSLNQEIQTGRHIRSSIKALGRLSSPRATAQLLDVVERLGGYADDALAALGTPIHGDAIVRLEEKAASWPKSRQKAAADALHGIGTDDALRAHIRLLRLSGSWMPPISDDELFEALRAQKSAAPSYPKKKPLPLP